MADSGSETIGSVASSVTSSFTNLTKLITGSSYLAGVGFSVASIEKFKMHKDNPTQIPIGTPDALLGVAAVLTFLPGIESAAAQSGVTAAEVKAAASGAGVTKPDVEAAAEAAGATSAQVSVAEAELKAKASG
jgi:intracellular multiplication protein IcmD